MKNVSNQPIPVTTAIDFPNEPPLSRCSDTIQEAVVTAPQPAGHKQPGPERYIRWTHRHSI
jgi:hypothetical protein